MGANGGQFLKADISDSAGRLLAENGNLASWRIRFHL